MLLLTEDRVKFAVPDGVVEKCGTLRAARASAGDHADQADQAEHVVPVPNVFSKNLARVVQYYMRMADMERADASVDARLAWKTGFFDSQSRMDVYMLMEAANYLDAAGLLDDAAAYVATLIQGRTSEEIREIFVLPRDMTAEEARARAAELAWAIK